jgi:hypothetical protein
VTEQEKAKRKEQLIVRMAIRLGVKILERKQLTKSKRKIAGKRKGVKAC